MNYKIGVIGSETLIFPFLQFGIATFIPKDENELRANISDMIEQNFGIIYIEDSYAKRIQDVLQKFDNSTIPIIVPIGEDAQGESYSKAHIDKMVERAIGKNILK